ncbi:hypothetical protein NM208_g13309 [Fusarium decemcellulare]|uniref:Uncharacterized protein n=1 Tax=Fusarium decemcellulare TaxID=57161 RepID=A0ACC1RLH8_9HYPO|nr:hypothetical protein NM208_g13309 [Fusarium decemcellulare]
MQSKTVFTFLALAATSFAVAVPRDDQSANVVERSVLDAELAAREEAGDASVQACPSGFVICGECNGTSCKIAGLNNVCQVGKCTVQSGGGDGKICGFHEFGGKIHCPGN